MVLRPATPRPCIRPRHGGLVASLAHLLLLAMQSRHSLTILCHLRVRPLRALLLAATLPLGVMLPLWNVTRPALTCTHLPIGATLHASHSSITQETVHNAAQVLLTYLGSLITYLPSTLLSTKCTYLLNTGDCAKGRSGVAYLLTYLLRREDRWHMS